MMASNFDDISLVRKLKSGDINAFNNLYFKYHKKLFAFIYRFLNNRHDSEDLLQKIFVIIWEKRDYINTAKSFNNYLFTIARNEIYDLLNKRVILEYHSDYITNITGETDDGLFFKKIVEQIYSLIEELPKRRKQIFLMNRELGLTYKQIAEKLKISENTVDTQIRHVLNYLRKELPQYIDSTIIILLFFL